MGRLAEAGVVTLQWEEDAKGNIFGEGLQSYEIDSDNELAIFQGEKCIKIRKGSDLLHAVSMAEASESVCRYYIKHGGDGRGHNVNEKGWIVK